MLIAELLQFRLDLKFEDDGTEVSAGNKPSNPLRESTYVERRSIRRAICHEIQDDASQQIQVGRHCPAVLSSSGLDSWH